jgi:hypothetical protein
MNIEQYAGSTNERNPNIQALLERLLGFIIDLQFLHSHFDKFDKKNIFFVGCFSPHTGQVKDFIII